MSVEEAEADKGPFRGALARRPGCATLAVSSGRLAVLSVPVVVAAGCSALLVDLEASGGSAGSAALLALAPVWAARPLLRSLLPSAMTACCSSAINVASGRFFLFSCTRTFHEGQRGKTSSCLGFGLLASTTTAARNR